MLRAYLLFQLSLNLINQLLTPMAALDLRLGEALVSRSTVSGRHRLVSSCAKTRHVSGLHEGRGYRFIAGKAPLVEGYGFRAEKGEGNVVMPSPLRVFELLDVSAGVFTPSPESCAAWRARRVFQIQLRP